MPEKNSTAQSSLCQEEKENAEQNSQVSESSTFWFPIYEGLFEHAPTIRDAVWFFMWLIARTTLEPDGRGKVLGGIPISDERPAGELGFPVKTVRRWRRILLDGGYIEVVRTPYGFKYTLLKSKKWKNLRKRECPKPPISIRENAQTGHSDRPNRAERTPAAGTLIKTTQGQHKEEAAAAAASVCSTVKEDKTERFPEAWKALNVKQCGSLKFVLAWEGIYRDHPEGELLSDTMEQAIQCCEEDGIKVPPPFFLAKRRIEEREAKDSFPTHPIPDNEYHAASVAKFNAEQEAKREAEDSRFNALSREEKVTELKSKLANVDDFIAHCKKLGTKENSRLVVELKNQKAELEQKIAKHDHFTGFPKPPERIPEEQAAIDEATKEFKAKLGEMCGKAR